ncbi:immunity 52 family protein [Corallococcus sp. M34]|uniref:immunity 52 family protein n=1 Tax=Citreicoccus inhibens TaxID=2849499 RepID=UPI001C213628|nr:immunity 52 family protein [Citreicoccus inhibens]MBU8896696.1 immunity 52 family protein [Citreicoccus inhibens]
MTATSAPETYPETYYAGAYWGARRESPEDCAQRTAHFLGLLAACDPFLAHWHKPAKTRKDARQLALMPPDVLTLAELFRHGVTREPGGPALEELGFRCSFDNGGASGDCATMRINGGVYSDAVPNHCVLSVPWRGPNADRLLTVSVLLNVVRATVLSWDPDWAVAMSTAYERRFREPHSAPFALGWITYLSNRLGRVPPLPAPVHIEPVEDRGTLIVLTSQRFTAANPEHVALARRVRELMTGAGLMPPIAP